MENESACTAPIQTSRLSSGCGPNMSQVPKDAVSFNRPGGPVETVAQLKADPNLRQLFEASGKRLAKRLAKHDANRRYRTTPKGWLCNYYTRLKGRNKSVALMFTREDFVAYSELSESFQAAWNGYKENNFHKLCAPELVADAKTSTKDTFIFTYA